MKTIVDLFVFSHMIRASLWRRELELFSSWIHFRQTSQTKRVDENKQQSLTFFASVFFVHYWKRRSCNMKFRYCWLFSLYFFAFNKMGPESYLTNLWPLKKSTRAPRAAWKIDVLICYLYAQLVLLKSEYFFVANQKINSISVKTGSTQFFFSWLPINFSVS